MNPPEARDGYWKRITDGSIGDEGRELATTPARGDALFALIADVGKAMSDAGSHVTSACGFHVHIDARDLNTEQICMVAREWSRHETELLSLVAPSRRAGNDYCKPVRPWYDDRGFSIASLWDYVYNEEYSKASERSKKRSKYDSARYRALNLHAVAYHGTLEFRAHQGTTNARKIEGWVRLLLAFVECTIRGDVWETGSALDALKTHDASLIDYIVERQSKFGKGN